MSSKATFAEISPGEYASLYRKGHSIHEIAEMTGRSYTFTRNSLLRSGVELRTKEHGTALYLNLHPDWSQQFEKYKVDRIGELTPEKVLLTSLIITEGFLDSRTIGFTNTQDQLHAEFTSCVSRVYGIIHVGRTGILSRVSSVQVAKDISLLMNTKAFSDATTRYILADPGLCAQVLRVVADTEGSMIISLREAPKNFTVECRVVLASTNKNFVRQLQQILARLGISSKPGVNCLIVGQKDEIQKFIRVVGFTPGIKVIRKKAGVSTWFGREKCQLAALCLRICSEQRTAKRSGLRGCFAECVSRDQLLTKLDAWYDESLEVMN